MGINLGVRFRCVRTEDELWSPMHDCCEVCLMTVNLALAFSSVGQDADESAPIAINTSDIFSFPLAENNDKIARPVLPWVYVCAHISESPVPPLFHFPKQRARESC